MNRQAIFIARARQLRLAVVQNLYDQEELTLAQANELLNAELTPGVKSTHYDDRPRLQVRLTDALQQA